MQLQEQVEPIRATVHTIMHYLNLHQVRWIKKYSVIIIREAYYVAVVGFFVAKFAEYPSPGESGGGKGVGMVHKEK